MQPIYFFFLPQEMTIVFLFLGCTSQRIAKANQEEEKKKKKKERKKRKKERKKEKEKSQFQ